tara:strand:- start:138 stop:764 length:627 start_codon:yes stop_codon:yes gene_type:complete
MKIISIFDRSGIMVRPWYQAGHEVVTIDCHLPRHDMPAICSDIRDVPIQPCDVLFSFVPCTEFAGSGARWWSTKPPERLDDALELVEITKSWIRQAEWWMVENPVGRLSSLWRKPSWSFDPHEYAQLSSKAHEERYTKKTCIWSNFEKPVMHSLSPILGSKMHRIPPSPDRQYLRSLTPAGFSQAVFRHLTGSPLRQIPLFSEAHHVG